MTIFRWIIYYIEKYFDLFNVTLDTAEFPWGFDSPSACKTITFALAEEQLSRDTSPIMEFLQKYSGQFLHVEIECTYSRENHLIEKWYRHFTAFLQILSTNSQLISVKFWYLDVCFQQLEAPIYVDVCRTIINFLESQHRLKKVEFRDCSFRFNEGVEILRQLNENNRDSLSHLVLADFIRYEPLDKVRLSFHDSFIMKPSAAAQNLPLIVDFPNLTNLHIDYPFLLENMVACLSSSTKTVKSCQSLSEIFVCYSNTKTPIDCFRGISSTDWQLLKSLCPDLKVKFSIFTNSASLRELEFLIVPSMPITELYYT